MPLVQVLLDKGVTGCALPNPSHHGKGGSSTGGRWRRRGRRAQDLGNSVSDEGGAAALSNLGLYWMGGNKNFHEDALLALIFLGHRGNTS